VPGAGTKELERGGNATKVCGVAPETGAPRDAREDVRRGPQQLEERLGLFRQIPVHEVAAEAAVVTEAHERQRPGVVALAIEPAVAGQVGPSREQAGEVWHVG